MTISLVPIAGLPLPIISYGGTFVMIIMFALGMVQSVWISPADGAVSGPPHRRRRINPAAPAR